MIMKKQFLKVVGLGLFKGVKNVARKAVIADLMLKAEPLKHTNNYVYENIIAFLAEHIND